MNEELEKALKQAEEIAKNGTGEEKNATQQESVAFANMKHKEIYNERTNENEESERSA